METATTKALKEAWQALYNLEMVQQIKRNEYRLTPKDMKKIEVLENELWEMYCKYSEEHEV